MNEIEAAILHAGNTLAGPDGIPLLVIKKAWPVYKKEITYLFQSCLEEGYHLCVFKNATLCALPKPGKRPRSLPRSYRLIALLSCLGKVLERVVARRLAHLALKYKLFSLLHFGATTRRSAVDAAATLTHDVEKAFQDHEVLTALAFDIKGAFDRVTNTRLIKRLWEQNIPLSIIRWVASFLNNRTAAVRLDGETGNQEPVKIGVPQGSPVAPILFMLFTAPLFKILTKEDKNAGIKIRGYIDDGLLTTRAPKEDISANLIQATFAKVEAWAAHNGMIFDQAKFEAIHFSRKRNFPNPEIILLSNATAGVEERVIKPTSKKSSMRWLGVYFDSRLSFSDHATKMASKDRRAAAGLSMLVKTTRGVVADIMRRAVRACIIPILTYGTPAW